MRLTFETTVSLQDIIVADTAALEAAVISSVRATGLAVKNDWRGNIRAAGLGNRLAYTIRDRGYPTSGTSLNAAALIWSKAPEIINSHASGTIIRSRDGFFLAIPTEAAGVRGPGRERITPLSWERRNGLPLRFVYRRGRPSLLVADDARISKRGLAAQKRGRRRKRDGILTGAQTVPIFILVPQVRLRKRLDLEQLARRRAAALPQMISDRWRIRVAP